MTALRNIYYELYTIAEHNTNFMGYSFFFYGRFFFRAFFPSLADNDIIYYKSLKNIKKQCHHRDRCYADRYLQSTTYRATVCRRTRPRSYFFLGVSLDRCTAGPRVWEPRYGVTSLSRLLESQSSPIRRSKH